MACTVNIMVVGDKTDKEQQESAETLEEGVSKEGNVDLSDVCNNPITSINHCVNELDTDKTLTVPLASASAGTESSESAVTAELSGGGNAQPSPVRAPEEEDDVPENFFDELMNEDFIDGLNVVDTWDEEEKNDDLRKKIQAKRETRRSPHRRDRRRDKDGKEQTSRRRSAEKKRSPGRKRSPGKKRVSEDKKRSNSKDMERERRDPNKTNRDILRDKDKCAKDQKAKLISEKLRVVETGLVPPGMEMEVDLLQIQVKETERIQKPNSVERRRVPSPRRKPYEAHPSPPRRPRRSPSLERKRSPARWVPGKEPVLLRRRSRSRSPRWRSPTRRLQSVERRMRERRRFERHERGSKSRSPRRRLRSKSPGSDVSERERWLRFRSKSPKSGSAVGRRDRQDQSKEGKFRRRSRSNSPRSGATRKTKSFLEELNDKLQSEENKLFLNEISKKLNPDSNSYAPVPVPPPQNFPGPQIMDYDQEFFIGQPDLAPPQNNFQPPLGPQHGFLPQDMGQHMVPAHQYIQMLPQPVPVPFGMPVMQNNTAPPQYYENEKEAFTNLFKEKKITLTDYLSVTAKFTDNSRPVNIQNKIKVISECQDAIKELTGEAKITGRFALRKLTTPLENIQDKYRSPLKRNPLVRFQFTHPGKLDKKQTMVSSLNKLLARFGKDLIFEESPKMEKPPTPEPPVNLLSSPKRKLITKSISCQTEPMRCEECLVRKYKVCIESHTQTNDNLSFDIGCQVNFDESPTKNILKNQSLAYLTPAQLLAQNKHDESPPRETKFDHHSSPDPKRARKLHPDDGFDVDYRYGDVDTRFRGETDRYKDTLGRAPIYDRDRSAPGSVGRSSMDSVFVMRQGSEPFNSGRQQEVFGNMGRSRGDPGYNRPGVEPFNTHGGGGMDPPDYSQGRGGMEAPFNGRSMEHIAPPFRGPGGPRRPGFEPNNFGRGRRF